MHEVLMRHPWATMLLVSRMNVGPNMLRSIDRTVGCLREAGFSWELADHAWNTLDAFTHGFTLQRINFPLEMLLEGLERLRLRGATQRG